MTAADSLDAPLPTWRRCLVFAHPGALACLGLLLGGVLLDLLALPPGPLPIAIFFADVPFLLLVLWVAGVRWKRWALLYGMLHYGIATRWLMEIHPAQTIMLMVILGPIYVLFGAFLRWFVRRGLPFVMTVGLLAVAEELTRTVWMGGMPWPARSLSFADGGALSALVPSASLFGAYGLSFLAASFSGLLAAVFLLRLPDGPLPPDRRFRRIVLVPWAALAVLGLAAILRVTAHDALAQDGEVWGPPDDLLVVQGAIPQALKNDRGIGAAERIFVKHLGVTKQGLMTPDAPGREVFAVLWPETMLPWPLVDPGLAARFPIQWSSYVNVVTRLGAEVPGGRRPLWMIGAIHHFERPGDPRFLSLGRHGTYDSLFFFDGTKFPKPRDPVPAPDLDAPDGRAPWTLGRHDKRQLVPGGEYTPLGEVFPILRLTRNNLSVIPELDRGVADQPPVAIWTDPADPSRRIHAGTAICFEVAFPARCRDWRLAGADVLINTANYGWFGETGFRSQVRAIARLRAAEMAMTVVMAGNTGPTAFYDPLGREYGTFHTALVPVEESASAPAGGDSTTHRPGFVRARVFRDPSTTLYQRFGDMPWYLLLALWVGLALRPAAGGRKAPDPRSPEPAAPENPSARNSGPGSSG